MQAYLRVWGTTVQAYLRGTTVQAYLGCRRAGAGLGVAHANVAQVPTTLAVFQAADGPTQHLLAGQGDGRTGISKVMI